MSNSVKYSCEKCFKTFSQKSHYDQHINRKKTCNIQTDKIQEIINNWEEAGQKANKLYDYVVDNFDSKKNSLELLNYYKLL
jgi:predicted ATP-binding protein involved in virulence